MRATKSSGPTLLHDLPNSALGSVVRYLSSKPARLNWVAFVHPNDALMAMHPSCALCDVARALFTQFCANSPNEVEDRPAVHMPDACDLDVVTKWLQSAGKTLADLTLCSFRHASWIAATAMLHALDGNCLALRRLDISRIDDPTSIAVVLEKTRGRLHELSACSLDMAAVERNCAGLRKLSLRRKYGSVAGALRVVGSTLEEISCPFDNWTKSEFEQVQRLCPRLSSIELAADGDDDFKAYANLLCSYGAQLHFAKLNRMCSALCEKIEMACPNVHCNLDDRDFETLQAQMTVLGPCVKKLEVDLLDNDVQQTQLETVSRSCRQLEDFMLRACPDTAVPALHSFFFQSMSLLKHLRLSIPDDGVDLSEVMLKLSKHCASLLEFKFVG